jgi:multidrug resistance efflux pump
MQKQINLLSVLVVGLLFVLTSCDQIAPQATADPQPTELPLELEQTATLAEGRLVPHKWVRLAFVNSGSVAEVRVQEGDTIKEGEVVALLGNRAQLEAAISSAEFELFSAEQAYKSLSDNLQITQNQALIEFNNARQAVRDAEKKLSYQSTRASQADIDNAAAQVVFARNDLDNANDDFAPYKNKPEDNLVRARLQIAQAAAQKAYDDAVRRYNGLTGTANEFDRNQAATEFEIASNQLKIAEDRYQLLLNGPDPDDLASAQARIDTALAQLTAAQANLANLELVAPFDGQIVELDLIPGQFVSPGEPVLLLADFSKWYVETDNLTENEVVEVALGQKVSVVPDALPDLEFAGEVVSIADIYEEKQGDTTYQVKLAIDQVDPLLRWGMRVIIRFD